jgi:hypothetical protein
MLKVLLKHPSRTVPVSTAGQLTSGATVTWQYAEETEATEKFDLRWIKITMYTTWSLLDWLCVPQYSGRSAFLAMLSTLSTRR